MTTRQELDERYGRSSARRRPAVIIGAAVAVAAVGALAWTTVAGALDDIGVDLTGFVIQDERTVTVSFRVSAPLGSDVACALEAQDEDHGIVGWRILEIPASDERARVFEESIPTLAEATTGLVNSCWVT